MITATWKVLVVLVPCLVLSLSCNGGDEQPPATSDVDTGVQVTKAEYGSKWPYTVDGGYLYCDPPGSNVVLRTNGRVYALNGRAMGNATERGYLNARETITLRDENGFFTIGDPSAIINRGLTMCR